MAVVVTLYLDDRSNLVMINLRAIARGFLTDISATCLFAAALSLIMCDPGSSDTALIERWAGTDLVNWTCLIGGLAMTGLGGFVTGRLSPRRELTHATLMGCLSFFVAMVTQGGCPLVDWFSFTGLVLTLPVAQLGGAVASLTRTHRTQE